MFQYAFVSSESLKKKEVFFLYKSGQPIELYKYFKLKKNIFYLVDRILFDHKGFKLFFSHYLRQYFYFIIKKIFISNYISSPKGTADPSTINDCYGKTFFNGFFQSPNYFKNYEKEVVKYFELKGSIATSYKKNYSFHKTGKTIVTVHIRKTDFLSLASYDLGGPDLSLPLSYYHNLIADIHKNENFYIFISDCPELILNKFDYLSEKHISIDSEIVDFQHMLNADICIIANSTFSWWAAYLNNGKNKLVYCPKYYLGFRLKKEYPVCIYPKSWIEIVVNDL